MRVLTVMHLAEITGPAKSLYPRLAWLAERDHLETLVPAAGPVERLYGGIGNTTICPLATLTYPSSPSAAVTSARRFFSDVSVLRAQMRRVQPDVVVVVTTMLPAALLASRLERRHALVYAAEIFDKPFVRSATRSAARAANVRYVLCSADVVVCCSRTVAKQFGGDKVGRVVTIYPGIAVAVPPFERLESRRRLGIPEGSLCLTVVGSISEGRGQDLVIRALPQVLEAHPDAFCLFAGVPHPRKADVVYQETLFRMARALQIEDRIKFAGFVDPVDEVYAASDIVVNPARLHEAFGRVALEALAAGRPVVAARVGAIPEILVDNKHALLVAPESAQAIAQAILRLANDAQLRQRLVKAGQELVRQRFSETSGVYAFRRVVDGVVLGHDPKRTC